MIKIQIPENEVGIRVFTEEVPDLKDLPMDVETILIGILLHCTLQYLQEHGTVTEERDLLVFFYSALYGVHVVNQRRTSFSAFIQRNNML